MGKWYSTLIGGSTEPPKFWTEEDQVLATEHDPDEERLISRGFLPGDDDLYDE